MLEVGAGITFFCFLRLGVRAEGESGRFSSNVLSSDDEGVVVIIVVVFDTSESEENFARTISEVTAQIMRTRRGRERNILCWANKTKIEDDFI